MSNRELAMEAISTLPEDAPLEEMARQLEFLAGIKKAEEQAQRREGIPAEDARRLVREWARR